MAGYAQTPLAKKLGIKDGCVVKLVNEPKYYFDLFSDLPTNLSFTQETSLHSIDFIHLFSSSIEHLITHAEILKDELKKDGLFWVSWPKASSGITTDLKREFVRNHLLSIGLVDIKVCAVDEKWSGLKFVYRRKDRN